MLILKWYAIRELKKENKVNIIDTHHIDGHIWRMTLCATANFGQEVEVRWSDTICNTSITQDAVLLYNMKLPSIPLILSTE